jgi:hypothetical protein
MQPCALSEIVGDHDPQLTSKQAAEFLNIKERTLESWRARKIGPRFVGYSAKCVRYPLSGLKAWQAAHTVNTEAQAS